MKVFISADIEGITGTTNWEECNKENSIYSSYKSQMTKEVLAACEGAIAAGATKVVVKDSHASGRNIELEVFPEEVEIIRGWSGHPYSMVDGLDSSFDAVMYIGYHSEAGSAGNPLSHTMTGNVLYVKINDLYANEFLIHSYIAAREGVPSVFLSGDKALCDYGKKVQPFLTTVAVKEGIGGMTKNIAPQKALRLIRENVEMALKEDLVRSKMSLPENFKVEIAYKEHVMAHKMSYYPNMKKIANNVLEFEASDFLEVARMFKFVL